MEKVLLSRKWITEESTGGVLYGPSGLLLYSLELPWRNNQFRISCIPEGLYPCVWHNSPKFGWTYLLTDTEPRTQILFHVGNYPSNTWGCILLGRTRSHNHVWNSRVALQDFYRVLKREPFILEIRSNVS